MLFWVTVSTGCAVRARAGLKPAPTLSSHGGYRGQAKHGGQAPAAQAPRDRIPMAS